MNPHGFVLLEILADAPEALQARLELELAGHGRIALDPSRLSRDTDVALPQVVQALDQLAEAGYVAPEVSTQHLCGYGLTVEDLTSAVCPGCAQELADDEITMVTRYIRRGERRRDVPWVVAIHGMNTTGAWQQRLTWLMATAIYRRSVPVYIYKYGRIEAGVLLKWRQRQLADRLADRLRELVVEPQGSRLRARPDVICHSFGTWLVGHVLHRHPDIRVGRIILVASVLRPDFGWQELIERGQVEAVLNHRAADDRVVRWATWFIPDAGPSGQLGFIPGTPVADRLEPKLDHSAFFESDNLPIQFTRVWQPFLREPTPITNSRSPEAWHPPPWLLQARLPRFVALLLIGALVGGIWLLPGWVLTSLVR